MSDTATLTASDTNFVSFSVWAEDLPKVSCGPGFIKQRTLLPDSTLKTEMTQGTIYTDADGSYVEVSCENWGEGVDITKVPIDTFTSSYSKPEQDITQSTDSPQEPTIL